MYFSARTEGRISYGHLGRTNLLNARCALCGRQHAGDAGVVANCSSSSNSNSCSRCNWVLVGDRFRPRDKIDSRRTQSHGEAAETAIWRVLLLADDVILYTAVASDYTPQTHRTARSRHCHRPARYDNAAQTDAVVRPKTIGWELCKIYVNRKYSITLHLTKKNGEERVPDALPGFPATKPCQ